MLVIVSLIFSTFASFFDLNGPLIHGTVTESLKSIIDDARLIHSRTSTLAKLYIPYMS